jgi:predicted phage terminase large subunit-like protein
LSALCLKRPETIPRPSEIQKERCFRSLKYYLRRAWAIVEPTNPFRDGWHIDAICEHLEALSKLEIQNLIINIPPRHMKSLSVAVFWPTWTWGPRLQPETRWLCASYAEGLATRDSLKCRRIIESEWYQALWGDVFRLTSDQNQKTLFENDKTGYRLAVGVGGGATGEGGDYLVVDDPHKLQDVGSMSALENAVQWWDFVMSSRGNNPATARRLITMQRIHQGDLTGHLLERHLESPEGEWEVLCLPAEYEPQTWISTIGWHDPRTELGELLWPEQFPKEVVDNLKVELGEQAAAMLQQRPTQAGGAIFLAEWWKDKNRYDPTDKVLRNRVLRRWISMDTGFKEREDAAYTSAVIFELTPSYELLVRDVIRVRRSFPKLVDLCRDLLHQWNRDGKLAALVIEDQASGISLIQTLNEILSDAEAAMIVPFKVGGSGKQLRWQAAAAWCHRGMVLLPHPGDTVPWLFAFENELQMLPNSVWKDQGDSFAQGILYLEHLLAEGLAARKSIGVEA